MRQGEARSLRLHYRKRAEASIRWDGDVVGVKFELYIKAWRVPEPTPSTVRLEIGAPFELAADELVTEPALLLRPDLARRPILASLTKLSSHSRVMRYEVDAGSELGLKTLYIPFARTMNGAERLGAVVHWELE